MSERPYYIVMIDYPQFNSREAVVNPELTRNAIIARIVTGEYDPDRILWIHEIADGLAIDVTDELIEAAERLRGEPEPDPFYSERALREETMADQKRMERV